MEIGGTAQSKNPFFNQRALVSASILGDFGASTTKPHLYSKNTIKTIKKEIKGGIKNGKKKRRKGERTKKERQEHEREWNELEKKIKAKSDEINRLQKGVQELKSRKRSPNYAANQKKKKTDKLSVANQKIKKKTN